VPLRIPRDQDAVVLNVGGKEVRLTNLQKVFWTDLGLTKGDLLRYYADVAHVLLPHVRDRAMVMKRYPHGASGEFLFMKRAPSPRPPWIAATPVVHHREVDDVARAVRHRARLGRCRRS
jgi:bifunctional non-homologous end joining protein LigD